jgi:glycosyltransferase involved in cell wall biosynthesis
MDWRKALLNAVSPAIFRRWPLQVGLYRSKSFVSTVRDHLAIGHFDLLHIQLSRLCGNLPNRIDIPVVGDFIDALSLNMRRRARQERFWIKPFAHLEASRLEIWERRFARRFQRTVVVSEADGAALGVPGRTRVVPNGVDLDRFRFQLEGRRPRSIVFSGNMSYFPNVDAAE